MNKKEIWRGRIVKCISSKMIRSNGEMKNGRWPGWLEMPKRENVLEVDVHSYILFLCMINYIWCLSNSSMSRPTFLLILVKKAEVNHGISIFKWEEPNSGMLFFFYISQIPESPTEWDRGADRAPGSHFPCKSLVDHTLEYLCMVFVLLH